MSESKSWIIVSDAGPSTHPVRHTSFEEAKTESFRLAKLRPDLKFGVFELVGTASATPKKKTVTKWMRVLNSGNDLIPGSKFYDTKQEANCVVSKFDPRYHGEPIPVLVEIDVDQSVAFEVPDANPAVEYRLYNGIPTWGFSRGETFFPFNSKEGAEHGTKYPSENYTGRPVSACPLVPEPGYAYYSF
jgi:hypothetical protein